MEEEEEGAGPIQVRAPCEDRDKLLGLGEGQRVRVGCCRHPCGTHQWDGAVQWGRPSPAEGHDQTHEELFPEPEGLKNTSHSPWIGVSALCSVFRAPPAPRTKSTVLKSASCLETKLLKSSTSSAISK